MNFITDRPIIIFGPYYNFSDNYNDLIKKININYLFGNVNNINTEYVEKYDVITSKKALKQLIEDQPDCYGVICFKRHTDIEAISNICRDVGISFTHMKFILNEKVNAPYIKSFGNTYIDWNNNTVTIDDELPPDSLEKIVINLAEAENCLIKLGNISVDNNLHITLFGKSSTLLIDSDTLIKSCVIESVAARTISIGSNCLIEEDVNFIAQTPHSTLETSSDITIGKHVWIRANCVIHPGFSADNNLVISTTGNELFKIRMNWFNDLNFLYSSPSKLTNDSDYIEPYWVRDSKRPSVSELTDHCMYYDVISFDIFDTLILRNVNEPKDVFTILSLEVGFDDFRNIRGKAEQRARRLKERTTGTREVLLSDIYNILSKDYGVEKKWMNREIELEYALSVPNPYMKILYDNMILAGKKVIFTTDMYLPRQVIETLLRKSGYAVEDNLYISNEYGFRKGDGTLQKLILEKYKGLRVIHIGDNKQADVDMSKRVGLDAFHYINVSRMRGTYESGEGNLAFSIYASLINNRYNTGIIKEENKYYTHGYRVGGILAAGYCEYIAEQYKIDKMDKIIFLSRDCKILNDLFDAFFPDLNHKYFLTSRYAALAISADRYYYDYIGRSILRHANKNADSKTIETVLTEAGFDYLCDYLEEADIEKYLFPGNLKAGKLEEFLYDCKDIVLEHNRTQVEAAKKYYRKTIGDAKNILVADIGWTGTCIEAFKYFCDTQLSELKLNIKGTLLATSRNGAVTSALSSGFINAYLYSPFQNIDIARRYMMGGLSPTQADMRHMPLEYLFTSSSASLIKYSLGKGSETTFEYTAYAPENIEEIELMQKGMVDFCIDYYGVLKKLKSGFPISPYLATGPLSQAINNQEYLYSIYKNFRYDATGVLYEDADGIPLFGDLFDEKIKETKVKSDLLIKKDDEICKNILLITPELTFTGTPNSLKRIAGILLDNNCYVEVWSAKPGLFSSEFEKLGVKVKIVKEKDIESESVIKEVRNFSLVICNTIVTDRYVSAFEKEVPIIWYIREATNIPDFTRGNQRRLDTLRNSHGITCVSDYAKTAIKRYTNMPVRVVHNAVLDRQSWARPHIFAQKGLVRFIQLGTLELRKGYDVFTEAWLSLPEKYKEKSELFFAGGFINSGTSFCSKLFSRIKGEDRIHFLGLIKDEQKKIEIMSEMDVVVVASRDESCSLVAMEGAMLSKPLIVTKNVGAKYLVDDTNGYIVETGSVKSLKEAFIRMIDESDSLSSKGASSRIKYEELASMSAHSREIMNMVESSILNYKKDRYKNSEHVDFAVDITGRDVVVSLTSHPGRINTVHICIQSLLDQDMKATKVVLTLSEEEFPGLENDLPKELIELCDFGLEILWCKDDLKPHKKYFYIMQQEPDSIVITTDDDVIYDKKLVRRLIYTHLRHPQCIIAARTNLMLFRPDGSLRSYDNWVYDYRAKRDIPMDELLPTGVGGILYPPRSVPTEAFDKQSIIDNCLFADDLWLKFLTLKNGYPAVLIPEQTDYREIEGSQTSALWKSNTNLGGNDVALKNILSIVEQLK